MDLSHFTSLTEREREKIFFDSYRHGGGRSQTRQMSESSRKGKKKSYAPSRAHTHTRAHILYLYRRSREYPCRRFFFTSFAREGQRLSLRENGKKRRAFTCSLYFVQIDDKTFKKLVKIAMEQIVNADGEKLNLLKIGGLNEEQAIVAKGAYAAITSFLLEAAKVDLMETSFASQLQETGLSNERIKLLVDVYNAKKIDIQKILGNIGFKFSKVVGIDWRLDYQLRSSTVGKLNSDIYFLKLKTLTATGVEKDFEFTCNFEQLKDLLAKIQDAKKQLDRVIKDIK